MNFFFWHIRDEKGEEERRGREGGKGRGKEATEERGKQAEGGEKGTEMRLKGNKGRGDKRRN